MSGRSPGRVTRRAFVGQTGLVLAGVGGVSRWAHAVESAAAQSDTELVTATTAAGKVRGKVNRGIRIFKGIPYGATTAGKNRFMPPVPPSPWTDTRDALDWGLTAPQTVPPAISRQGTESEDCLVLNVFTPALDGAKRPVMVWLHGGGWQNGSGSAPITDGTNLARTGDVVLVSINHRLNVFGYTELGHSAGGDFAASGAVGLLDIVAALQWIRDNIDRFGGDPNLVTIFGQSGGGRKVAALMAMPAATGLFQRAIVESGAILQFTAPVDAQRQTSLLLAALGLKSGQMREFQNVPMEQLLIANEKANDQLVDQWPIREHGWSANTPTLVEKYLPHHPWDPKGPALSKDIPLMIGWAHTEETNWFRPTPENLALDEASLKQRVEARLRAGTILYKDRQVQMFGKRAGHIDVQRVIDAFRWDNPGATPFDLYVLIASEDPRATHAREIGKRKAAQRGAPAYVYRFDWQTPEGGGMRSPHAIDIQFAFNNIALGGKLISKRQDAYDLATRVSASWVAFARSGNPGTPQLPNWPAYSAEKRDTMLFNIESRVAQDPNQRARLAMEHVLGLG
jgi:para-nitrobenzyl esterase